MSISSQTHGVSLHVGKARVAFGNLMCMLSMMTWAMGFPAAEALLVSWSPLHLITARLLLAVLVLLPIWILLDGPRAVLNARWGLGMMIGGVSFGLAFFLLLLAQDMTDAVTVAIMSSAAPISAVLCELVWNNRPFTRWLAAGLGAAVAGGVIAVGQADANIGLGAVLVVVASFLFAWGSMRTVRDLRDQSAVGRTTLTLAGGFVTMAIVTLVHALVTGVSPQVPTMGFADWANLGIYAFAGMALSQLLWLLSVNRLGVAIAAFHMNVAPFYVMLIMLALGSAWDWRAAMGAAVVACGVILAQRD